ncbi:hypothetical protein D9619_012073 [Psilocybe cf. subviscida]|uniref:Uncharacterized protein n=1 Tax=Psilocybe cf. subviscida TaxID=2480587 RepID=A0A8H5EZR2_9AGAR|nr:hypothetical protein D9619_012073 [Psilocybe cf. subviscida]
MSVYLPPSPSIDPIDPLSQPTLIVPLTFEEALLISVYLATTIYGINVVLALACLRPIANPKRARNSGSLALVFNGYIFIMACLATEATLEDALSSAANFKDRMSFTGNLCTPYALPLSILGADGFMIWRCYILYGALSGMKKHLLTAVLAILGCSSVGSAIWFWVADAAGNVTFLEQTGPEQGFLSLFSRSIFALFVVTAAVNTSVSILIAARLLYGHHILSISQPGEKISSPYITAMAICVESSSMITVVAIAGAVSYSPFIGLISVSYMQIPRIIIPQVCVISPFLIMYRIAQGRGSTAARLEETLCTGSIAFGNAQQDGEEVISSSQDSGDT